MQVKIVITHSRTVEDRKDPGDTGFVTRRFCR